MLGSSDIINPCHRTWLLSCVTQFVDEFHSNKFAATREVLESSESRAALDLRVCLFMCGEQQKQKAEKSGAESAVKRDLNTIVLDEWNCWGHRIIRVD